METIDGDLSTKGADLKTDRDTAHAVRETAEIRRVNEMLYPRGRGRDGVHCGCRLALL